MCGRRTKGETLIWTDASLFALEYIGGQLVYAPRTRGANCGIISRQAVAVFGGKAAWMGRDGFFIYDGFARPLPCPVQEHVFEDFNRTQRAKCWAMTNSSFNEVWFYYPSSSSLEPDRYVIWNHVDNVWSIGALTRSAGIDREVMEYPVLADLASVYEHERGSSRDGAGVPFIESGPVAIGKGEVVMDVLGLIPDEATSVAGGSVGSTRVKLFLSHRPGSATERTLGPYTLTERTDIRATARYVRVRHEEVEPGNWRIGSPLLEVQAGSQR